MNGRLPWFSLEASADEIWLIACLPVANSEDVRRCMDCPYDECRNCMGPASQRREHASVGRPTICDVEAIRRMVNEGMSNKEICEKLGCSRRTADRYIRRFAISA